MVARPMAVTDVGAMPTHAPNPPSPVGADAPGGPPAKVMPTAKAG